MPDFPNSVSGNDITKFIAVLKLESGKSIVEAKPMVSKTYICGAVDFVRAICYNTSVNSECQNGVCVWSKLVSKNMLKKLLKKDRSFKAEKVKNYNYMMLYYNKQVETLF